MPHQAKLGPVMIELKLEFEENEPDKYPRVFAQVIVKGYQLSRLSGMPAVTRDCDVYCELDHVLKHLEREIKKVRETARRRFRQYDQRRRSRG